VGDSLINNYLSHREVAMLPNYQNILYTTDLTPNSEYAFKHAILLARKSSAKVHIVHVLPEVDPGFRSYVTSMMGEGKLEAFEIDHEKQARDTLSKKLEDFTRNELADHPEDYASIANIEVFHGNAVAEILKAADKIDADVIIMGTHGKGAVAHTFLGSVAEKVLQKSKRPVFVIPIPD
jgi:nucleotide-binding universal stress UspA family protein